MIPFLEQSGDALRMFEFDNMRFPAHLHRHVEWVWARSGTLRITISGKEYSLRDGGMALVFPNVVHSYTFDTDCRGLLTIFAPDMVSEYSALLLQRRPSEPCFALSDGPEARDVRYCLARLFDEHNGARDESVCRAYLHLALARTIPLLELSPRAVDSEQPLMYRAINYISENYSQPLTLDSTADALCVSRYHLSRLFSQKFGSSFRAYLNELRIAQAQMMLRETGLSITEICYSCGFDTTRTFNRAFAGIVAQTPSSYRERTRGLSARIGK